MEKDTFHQSTIEIGDGPEALDMSLLVVDDDRSFCDRLARALSSRGFTARAAMSVAEAMEAIRTAPPAFAVIDLRLGDGSGLDVIRALKARRADARGLILTGYGAIATAVAAVKIGAFDYVAKPVKPTMWSPLSWPGGLDMPANMNCSCRPLGSGGKHPAHLRGQHPRRVRNRPKLSMHRRTLQRILAKRAPK